jgi:rhodanese-related sulfurtransferase
VDIREADEHARENIPGARHLPLSKLDEADLALHAGRPVIFHCRSGARTQSQAPRLAGRAAGACEAFILEGGIDAWKKAGLPVATDRSQPLELQRQVQIGAGSLTLLGVLLGFYAIPAVVGAWLVTAGVTGFCGMARLLMRAPWNKSTYGAGATKLA